MVEGVIKNRHQRRSNPRNPPRIFHARLHSYTSSECRGSTSPRLIFGPGVRVAKACSMSLPCHQIHPVFVHASPCATRLSHRTFLAFPLAFPIRFRRNPFSQPPHEVPTTCIYALDILISVLIVMLRRLHVVFLLSPSMPGSSSPATLTLYILWSGSPFAVSVSTQNTFGPLVESVFRAF